MNQKQAKIIEAAIYEALDQIPDGSDRQLTDWIMANRLNSFPSHVRKALVYHGLEILITKCAREMGVELKD